MKYLTLCENHLFAKTFSGGVKHYRETIGVFVLKDKHAYIIQKKNPEKKKLNRIGISLSGKFGNAVERNRAKRLVREAYRQIISEYDIVQGKIIVIVPSKAVKGRKMQDVKKDMLCCFERTNLILNDKK